MTQQSHQSATKTLLPTFAVAALFAAVLLAGPSSAGADTASVANHVSASASSGGNTVTSQGSIRNGTSTASVHIDETINGVPQAPIDMTTSSAGSIGISAEARTEASSGSVTSTHAVTVNPSPRGVADPAGYLPPKPSSDLQAGINVTSSAATATITITSTPIRAIASATATSGLVEAASSTLALVVRNVSSLFSGIIHWITSHV